MPNTSIENILYSRGKDPLEFRFDTIPPAPPILSFMTVRDIEILNHTATSLKYSGNMKKKYEIIDKIMTNRGFVHFHTGTNRIVYRPLESYNFLVKIALDRAGIKDSPSEFMNQAYLQPFVTKIFECTPCGTVATVERVKPLIRKEEFISIAGDIFDLINKKIIGKYILDDIGSDYFMNWGLRAGFGPVLLDFPYVYKLDGDKLMCTKFIPELNQRCSGLIDYDLGFNNLVCNECGRKYNALDLEKKDSGIEIIKGGSVNMKVILRRGNKTVERNTGTDYIKRNSKKKDSTEKKNKRIQVLFKGQKRDTSQKLTQPCLSHDDMMKARKEIMDRQNDKKNKQEEVKVDIEVHNMDEVSKNKRKYVDEEMENAFKEQSASLDDGLLVDESSIENPGLSVHDDLTDINRIEDEYGHLEEEFGDETYEKIYKGDTKKFY